jgi:hypothetical protein
MSVYLQITQFKLIPASHDFSWLSPALFRKFWLKIHTKMLNEFWLLFWKTEIQKLDIKWWTCNWQSNGKIKVKLSVPKHHTMKTYKGVEIKFHTHTLNLCTRLWLWSLSCYSYFTSREEPLYPMHGGLGGPHRKLEHGSKEKNSCPCQESNSGHPASSPILYSLGYCGSLSNDKCTVQTMNINISVKMIIQNFNAFLIMGHMCRLNSPFLPLGLHVAQYSLSFLKMKLISILILTFPIHAPCSISMTWWWVLFKINVAMLLFSFILSHPIEVRVLDFVHCSIQSHVQLSSSVLIFIILPERSASV